MDEQRPGIFDDGERADDSTNQRAEGKLTDTSESAQLVSDVGERVQKLAGAKLPVNTDRLRVIESTQTDSDAPFPDDEEPLVPEGAFITAPSPDTPVPISYGAPGPSTETAPYSGIGDDLPFGEGDEIRGWTAGAGEQQGSGATRDTVSDE